MKAYSCWQQGPFTIVYHSDFSGRCMKELLSYKCKELIFYFGLPPAQTGQESKLSLIFMSHFLLQFSFRAFVFSQLTTESSPWFETRVG